MSESDDTDPGQPDDAGDDPGRLRRRISLLEGRNRELGERLAAMQGSTSWRMTRPVREVMEGLRGRRRGGAARLARHGGSAPANGAAAAILETGLFDAAHYRAAAGLGAAMGDVEAADHYARLGEGEGIRPNPGFDPAVYADLHREILGSGMGPLVHYARYGRAEGRATDFDPDPYIRDGGRPFDPAKTTVLLACHEASRTGAPILGWNLARELNRDHNLVLVVQEPYGDLLELFAREASVVVGPFPKRCLTWFWMARFGRDLARRYAIDHALANSIETQWFLIGLAAAGIPTVTLVHEYPTGPESEGRMQSGMALSQQVVFDAASQHEAALGCWPGITPRATHVFHQGASAIPPDPKASGPAQRRTDPEGAPVHRAVRGDGTKPVVLGLGTVSMRKGPDLFIACAVAAARRLGPGRARFVWIGHVPKPHPEGHFMDWLADQAKRSGLGRDLVFLDAVAEIEDAYAAADAAMISSRLDPFPNVAMDVALAGKPVVAFLGANGFADWLAEDPATAKLAVPYLDADAAGAALAGVLADLGERQALGAALRLRGQRDFTMARYRERLAPLVFSAKAIAAQERRDVELLLGDDTFSADLWLDPNRRLSREEAVRLHVREAAAGHEANQYCRRPALGFVPQDYADHHPDLDREPYPNPLADWIRAGKPQGSWTHPVLVAPLPSPLRRGEGGEGSSGRTAPDVAPPAASRPEPSPRTPLDEGEGNHASLRAALHLHLHYPELADGFLAVLGANGARLDLFVSTTSEAKADDLARRFAGYDRGTVRIETCPNRGRDLGPMLSRFAGDLQGYDVFGHLHGKRSLALTSVGLSTDLGVRWHEFLTQHLLGDQVPMADLILDRFAADPTLGLVFPEDPNLTGWSLDREIARDLARRMAPDMAIPQSIDFPIGTMFWARPAALKPLFDLGLGWDDYPEEPVPIDGTMLHALERLLPVIVRHQGFGLMTTHVPGVTR